MEKKLVVFKKQNIVHTAIYINYGYHDKELNDIIYVENIIYIDNDIKDNSNLTEQLENIIKIVRIYLNDEIYHFKFSSQLLNIYKCFKLEEYNNGSHIKLLTGTNVNTLIKKEDMQTLETAVMTLLSLYNNDVKKPDFIDETHGKLRLNENNTMFDGIIDTASISDEYLFV